MSLIVIKEKNEFHLFGNLKAHNAYEIRKFFKVLLQKQPSVCINVSALDQIDVSAVMMLKELQFEAFCSQKECVVKKGANKKIEGILSLLQNSDTQVGV